MIIRHKKEVIDGIAVYTPLTDLEESIANDGGKRHYTICIEGKTINVLYTEEEELLRNSEEQEYAASANDRAAAKIRTERDAKLTESDWTQVADAPVDQAAWATYRQALRDIPDQAGFPNNINWPTEP
jgi:nitrogen fixation protein